MSLGRDFDNFLNLKAGRQEFPEPGISAETPEISTQDIADALMLGNMEPGGNDAKDTDLESEAAQQQVRLENSATSVAKVTEPKPKKKSRIQAIADLTKEETPAAPPEQQVPPAGSFHVFNIILPYLSE